MFKFGTHGHRESYAHAKNLFVRSSCLEIKQPGRRKNKKHLLFAFVRNPLVKFRTRGRR